jgi:hypothetical protein
MRQAIEQAHAEFSRRGFFKRTAQAAGIGLFWERFGARMFAQTSSTDPKAVYGAIGNIVIPVDEDPGWATFEPGISDYGLNIFVPQVLLGGGQQASLTFQGVLGTLIALNETPPLIGFSTSSFLGMSEQLQSQYIGNILSGQFESYGVQDILFTGAFVSIFSTRAVFFSNYPNHLATPGAEFQVLPASSVKTGWDIMGFRGPVGAAEEKQLRDKYANHQVLPGMDPNNPYI